MSGGLNNKISRLLCRTYFTSRNASYSERFYIYYQSLVFVYQSQGTKLKRLSAETFSDSFQSIPGQGCAFNAGEKGISFQGCHCSITVLHDLSICFSRKPQTRCLKSASCAPLTQNISVADYNPMQATVWGKFAVLYGNHYSSTHRISVMFLSFTIAAMTYLQKDYLFICNFQTESSFSFVRCHCPSLFSEWRSTLLSTLSDIFRNWIATFDWFISRKDVL